MKNIFLLFLMQVIVGQYAIGQTPTQTLPDFKFFRNGHEAFTNKNLPTGRKLFFVFFDSDCEHCQRAMANFNQQYKSFSQAAIYLVSLDSQDKMIHFMNKYGSRLKTQKNVVLLQDSLNQFITKFKPVRYPSMFLYSADHKLLDYEDNEETLFRFVRLMGQKSKTPG